MKRKSKTRYFGLAAFTIFVLVFVGAMANQGEKQRPSRSLPSVHDPCFLHNPHSEHERFHGPIDEQGRYRYGIGIDEQGLIAEQTQRGVRSSGQRYVRDDPGTLVYREQLAEKLDAYIQMISLELEREIVPQHRFLLVDPGFSAWLEQSEVEIVDRLPGVKCIGRDYYEYPD